MKAARLRLGAIGALLLVGLVIGASSTPAAPSPNLVVSQVYGGGGNLGAPFTNDFVEIFNRGSSDASLNDLSLQYTSATGTGNFGANSTQLTELPNVTLHSGQYFLVQEASGGTNGSALPTADLVDATAINMGATAGKVALVSGTSSLACNGSTTVCDTAALARIVDLVGYGNATFFEGGGPASTLSNAHAARRISDGCVDTDNNSADFAAVTPPTPRNTASPLKVCPADEAPAILSRTPEVDAKNVPVNSNIAITFTEPVNVTGAWFSITCADTGNHSTGDPVVTNNGRTFTLDPTTDFGPEELCTVGLVGSRITDQDTIDPPDELAGNPSWGFTTETPIPLTPIHEIQGAGHTSPKTGQLTTSGIVTGKRSNGYYMQDPNPDSDDATSEGIFVFTSSAPSSINVGDSVRVAGTVSEFRPGGASSNNLTTTELTAPTTAVISTGNPLPTPIVVGAGGRVPPSSVVDNDSFAVFDPAEDAIDFYETLEGMRLQVNNPVTVGPRNSNGEVWVLADDGAGSVVRTARGGILLRPDDVNPERIQLDDAAGTPTPNASVGDHFDGPAIGVLDYDFGNYEIQLTSPLGVVSGGITREVTADPGPNELAVATFNVENLNPRDAQSKFDGLANEIVDNLRSPDVIALEEIQDNNGTTNDGTVAADQTLAKLAAAVQAAGGPTYVWRQIDPVNNQDGGAPGGNIRVGFFFRTDRGLSFVDRPGGDSITPTTVVDGPDGPQLSASPGRVDPANGAWNASRKPLAGEFRYRGQTFFLIANHFNSKTGDQPLFGRFQPPARNSEAQRHDQAQLVNNFVDSILAYDADAKIVVLGDINDFEFSETMNILTANDDVLHDLMNTLPQAERYSYVFEGNSQVLDHIVVSDALQPSAIFDPVHVNAEFFDQQSDHDPSVAGFTVNAAPTVSANGPYTVAEGSSVTVSATGSDPEGDALTYTWDLDNNGTFETAGQSATFSAAAIDGPAMRTIAVRASDGTDSATAQATVNITNVRPTATFNAPEETFAGFPFTLSLTNPSDPASADTFTYAFDCGSGYGPFGTASSTTCPTSLPGERQVGGKIRDDDGDESEYRDSVQVVVTFDGLCSLVRQVVTSVDVANALCDKLSAAKAANDRGSRTGQLAAFRNQVDAQTGKSISSADAKLLKDLSELLQTL